MRVMHRTWSDVQYLQWSHLPSFLLQRCEEVEVMKGQVCQEQKLRAVAESCLMERDESWNAIQCQLREAQAITKDAGVLLDQIK